MPQKPGHPHQEGRPQDTEQGTPRGTKKQHYVPQLHLRQFTNRDPALGPKAVGKLAVYDKQSDRSFWQSPDDVGHENHFLTVDELDMRRGAGTFFERFFQEAEDRAAPAIADILARVAHGLTTVITPDTRFALAIFLANQRLRTKRARANVLAMNDALDRVMRELHREHPGFRMEGWAPDTPPKAPTEAHAESLLNVDLLAGLARTLYDHVWVVFANATAAPLYTSDHPVALYPHVQSDVRGAGPASFGAEVSFPLSPSYLLTMVERRFATAALPPLLERENTIFGSLAPEHVEFQRSLQVSGSLRFVYAPAEDFALAREMCEADPLLREPTQIPMVVNYRGRPL